VKTAPFPVPPFGAPKTISAKPGHRGDRRVPIQEIQPNAAQPRRNIKKRMSGPPGPGPSNDVQPPFFPARQSSIPGPPQPAQVPNLGVSSPAWRSGIQQGRASRSRPHRAGRNPIPNLVFRPLTATCRRPTRPIQQLCRSFGLDPDFPPHAGLVGPARCRRSSCAPLAPMMNGNLAISGFKEGFQAPPPCLQECSRPRPGVVFTCLVEISPPFSAPAAGLNRQELARRGFPPATASRPSHPPPDPGFSRPGIGRTRPGQAAAPGVSKPVPASIHGRSTAGVPPVSPTPVNGYAGVPGESRVAGRS